MHTVLAQRRQQLSRVERQQRLADMRQRQQMQVSIEIRRLARHV